jgi:predicted DNA-binding protein (UPF0251 family)
MLQVFPSLTVGQDNLTVFFPYNPRVYIAQLARLVQAYNPYGAVPPASAKIVDLAQFRLSAETIASLNSSMATLSRTYGDMAARLAPLAAFEPSISEMANWFNYATMITPLRDFVFESVAGNEPIGKPELGLTPEQLGELRKQGNRYAVTDALMRLSHLPANQTAGVGGGWLHDANPNATGKPESQRRGGEVTDLIHCTLWASYARLLASDFLNGAIKAPDGAPKDIYATIERATRLATLVGVLRRSIEVADLRERAAVLTSPAFAPWITYLSPEAQDALKNYASKLLALRVHPWIAEAERLRLPARRYTEWATASNTMGVSRGGMWQTLNIWAKSRTGEAGKFLDMRGLFVHPGSTVHTFLEEARKFFLDGDMFDPSHVTSAESLLGLTTPGAPPMVHLHGQTWKALAMTGSMASEAPSDLWTLLLRSRFPLLDARGRSELAGTTTAYHYNAGHFHYGSNSVTAVQSPLPRPKSVPPLYVQPQMVDFKSGYALRQLTPEMIKPVNDTEYFGDEDAIYDDYTLEGLARLLGYSDTARMLAMPGIQQSLTHLFQQSADTKEWVNVAIGDRIFHSSRTRQPWRKAVEILEGTVPQKVLALDHRTAPIERDIEAVIGRTPELPAMSASTLPFADAVAIDAAKKLGVAE